MFLKIERKANGYIVTGNDNYEYLIQDREEDELKSHEELLWVIINWFNFGGTKHDKERIRVTREINEDYNATI